MILQKADIDALDSHWAVKAVGSQKRRRAIEVANSRLVNAALQGELHLEFQERREDEAVIERLATAYEVAAAEGLDALLHASAERQHLATQAQAGAFRAFEMRRVLPIPVFDVGRVLHILHLAALAYAGDRSADMRRWLMDHGSATAPPTVDGCPWDRRVLFRVYDAWLRLFRKDSWNDLHQIASIIADLRAEQAEHEGLLLSREEPVETQAVALRLVALYHWARATERLAEYMLQGQPRGIEPELDIHFEHATNAAAAVGDATLEMLLRWLHLASRRMVAGSLWTVTAGINSRVSKFVKLATSKEKNPMIELLPPQRYALAEQGLLDPASRAIVIDLPTSGGKTVLAEFRILQALNQFAQDGGWVAYVAPTRALVGQILRRLRRDFGPLGVRVEQVSGGIEIDAFEEELLGQDCGFDILIATPEKLDLIIRNGKLDHRQLALIVVDEAHNIEDEDRGLRIELMLATIRQDSPHTNFLLLMPFVPDAEVLARWLDPAGGKPISLGTTAWQPNERIIGLYEFVKLEERGPKNRKQWAIDFETVATTPKTIHLKGRNRVNGACPLNLTSGQAASLKNLTTAMATVFSDRGTSIAVGDSIAHVWEMAEVAAQNLPAIGGRLPEEVKLVRSFLKTEVGEDFALVRLLADRVAVHHAGLPDEVRSLIEWLAEEGHIRVLCATTTIAQGINFPVSSVFLSRAEHGTAAGPRHMSQREFWNLAGRAGRVGQDSVGIVGIATNSEERSERLKIFLGRSLEHLASRLISLAEQIVGRPLNDQMRAVIHEDQWADFRSFVAHILKEAKSLQEFRSQTEQILRSTFGYSALRSTDDQKSQDSAATLITVTNAYAQSLSSHMGSVTLADTTGFDPEGVRMAMHGLDRLERRLKPSDWEPQGMFGNTPSLSNLINVMMQLPRLRNLAEIAGSGPDQRKIADIAKAWVGGEPIKQIASAFFQGDNDTERISDACKGINRALIQSGVWGLAALSKLPGSGIDWKAMSEEEKRKINLLPAFLYHGVDSEEGVLMRMNQVPRSVAKTLGERMRQEFAGARAYSVSEARAFVKDLAPAAWQSARPAGSTLSGSEYRQVWQRLSGESD